MGEIAKQKQKVRMDITYSGENEWNTVARVEISCKGVGNHNLRKVFEVM